MVRDVGLGGYLALGETGCGVFAGVPSRACGDTRLDCAAKTNSHSLNRTRQSRQSNRPSQWTVHKLDIFLRGDIDLWFRGAQREFTCTGIASFIGSRGLRVQIRTGEYSSEHRGDIVRPDCSTLSEHVRTDGIS
jgi:hypothetical protein